MGLQRRPSWNHGGENSYITLYKHKRKEKEKEKHRHRHSLQLERNELVNLRPKHTDAHELLPEHINLRVAIPTSTCAVRNPASTQQEKLGQSHRRRTLYTEIHKKQVTQQTLTENMKHSQKLSGLRKLSESVATHKRVPSAESSRIVQVRLDLTGHHKHKEFAGTEVANSQVLAVPAIHLQCRPRTAKAKSKGNFADLQFATRKPDCKRVSRSEANSPIKARQPSLAQATRVEDKNRELGEQNDGFSNCKRLLNSPDAKTRFLKTYNLAQFGQRLTAYTQDECALEELGAELLRTEAERGRPRRWQRRRRRRRDREKELWQCQEP